MQAQTKKFVYPGELVAGKPLNLDGTFVKEGKTYAAVIALMQDERFIPLKGLYVPNYGDVVIGVVSMERFSGYTIDLASPYDGTISAKEIREEFKVGDVVSAKIVAVNEMREAMLLEAHKLADGVVLDVEAVKVPRIIGRNGSMLAMLQQYTGSAITVGKNGRCHVRGGDTGLAANAIRKIVAEAHTSGLTDRVKDFLESHAKPRG